MRKGDVLSSHLRAPAALVALMIIVAAALAWLGAGCSTSAMTAHDAATDSNTTPLDTAADTTTPVDGPLICALDAAYTYRYVGGLGVLDVQTTLASPASYQHVTTFTNIADPMG